MSSTGSLPTKYCKYHLFGRCKASICHHTHDLHQAKVISCRKMNANTNDIDRIIQIIKDNVQVKQIKYTQITYQVVQKKLIFYFQSGSYIFHLISAYFIYRLSI